MMNFLFKLLKVSVSLTLTLLLKGFNESKRLFYKRDTIRKLLEKTESCFSVTYEQAVLESETHSFRVMTVGFCQLHWKWKCLNTFCEAKLFT